MAGEIGLDEMVGDDGGLGLRAAPRLEQTRSQVAQLLMIDVHRASVSRRRCKRQALKTLVLASLPRLFASRAGGHSAEKRFRESVYRHPAIDVERRAGDVAGVVRGEEGDCPGDL